MPVPGSNKDHISDVTDFAMVPIRLFREDLITITKASSNPLLSFGSSQKSILICCQGRAGTESRTKSRDESSDESSDENSDENSDEISDKSRNKSRN